MKIGIDGIPLSEKKTGVGHYTFEIACGLATAKTNDAFQVVSQIPYEPSSIVNCHPELQNLSFVQPPVNPISKHWWTIGLPRYIKQQAFDLFHGTNYDVPVWGGCPSVLTIHDLSLLLHAKTHEQSRVQRARLRLPIMARLATRIIVPTESVKTEACEHLRIGPAKIDVIPEAPRKCFRVMAKADAKKRVDQLGIEDLFILYVGAIEPRKNLITLVRAFEEIYKSTDLRPQLVMAGPTGWLSDDLFAYVERSDVKNRMLLTGYLGDEDLRALYSTCAVMSYPALYEGAGLPPLEAMACGAPVITSDARAIVEMVGDGARVVAAMDHQGVARQIVELMTDTKARELLVQRGLRRAAQFTWARAVEATYETYLRAYQPI